MEFPRKTLKITKAIPSIKYKGLANKQVTANINTIVR